MDYAGLVRMLLAIGVLYMGVVPAESAEPNGRAEPIRVSLRPEAGETIASMFTPAKVLKGGVPFAISGPQGVVVIGGQSMLLGGKWDGRASRFGLDADGDGKISDGEYLPLGRDFSAGFHLKLGHGQTRRDQDVTAANVRLYLSGSSVARITGSLAVASAVTGTFAGQTIRLLDDNLDGQYTQDGHDAISIGPADAKAAIPLMQVHEIGGAHYRLDVSPDGTSMALLPLPELPMGVVRTPLDADDTLVLAVTDEQGRSYDLRSGGAGGVPPGEYRLSYAVIGHGSQTVLVTPTDTSPSYAIEAGKVNTLRLGAPLRVDCSVRYADQAVTVYSNIRVLGDGDELYGLDLAGQAGRPRVALLEGERVVAEGPMSYG